MMPALAQQKIALAAVSPLPPPLRCCVALDCMVEGDCGCPWSWPQNALERLQPYCAKRCDVLAAAQALRRVSALGRMHRFAARHAPLSLSLDLHALKQTRGQLRGCLRWLLTHRGPLSIAIVPPPAGIHVDLPELELLARLLQQHGPEAAQPLRQLTVHAPDLGCRFDAGEQPGRGASTA